MPSAACESCGAEGSVSEVVHRGFKRMSVCAGCSMRLRMRGTLSKKRVREMERTLGRLRTASKATSPGPHRRWLDGEIASIEKRLELNGGT